MLVKVLLITKDNTNVVTDRWDADEDYAKELIGTYAVVKFAGSRPEGFLSKTELDKAYVATGNLLTNDFVEYESRA